MKLTIVGLALLVPSTCLAQSVLARWTAVEEHVIGSVDGPAALSFVRDLEIGPGDQVLVTQAGSPGVTVLTIDGRFVRSFGRRGQGPGEFSMAAWMGWTGDTLWVTDLIGNAINLFDLRGQVLGRISYAVSPPSGLLLAPTPQALLSNGSAFARLSSSSRMILAGRVKETPLVSMSDREILAIMGMAQIEAPFIRVEVGPGRSILPVQPLAEGTLVAVARDGQSIIAVERPSSQSFFRVTRISLSGDTLFTRRYSYQPQRVGRAAGEQVLGRLTASMRPDRLGMTHAALKKLVLQKVSLPDYYPPISALVAGNDGSIWLRREENDSDRWRWIVLDTHGAPLAELELPADLKVFRADQKRLWATLDNELGIPFIRVYRVIS